MEQRELEIWWSSLPISEKERIARKGLMKASKDGSIDESLAFYPGCTSIPAAPSGGTSWSMTAR